MKSIQKVIHHSIENRLGLHFQCKRNFLNMRLIRKIIHHYRELIKVTFHVSCWIDEYLVHSRWVCFTQSQVRWRKIRRRGPSLLLDPCLNNYPSFSFWWLTSTILLTSKFWTVKTVVKIFMHFCERTSVFVVSGWELHVWMSCARTDIDFLYRARTRSLFCDRMI